MTEITEEKEDAIDVEELVPSEKLQAFIDLSDLKKTEKLLDILGLYIAGEEKNTLLTFFLVLSNYKRPLRTIGLYSGDSSGGKSHVSDNVIENLIPEEDYMIIDSATPQALKYDPKLNEIKFLYLREMQYQTKEEMVEMMKSIFNDGTFRHLETVRENDGESTHNVSKMHQIDPIGIWTTYSFEHVQIDIVNRAWKLTPDQSHEQTQKITSFLLNKEKNRIEYEFEKRKNKQKEYLIQEYIKQLNFDYEVVIPFINKIKSLFPKEYLNVRRDVSKIVNLIKIITLWNQYNRRKVQVGDIEFIFAEYNDLKIALDMCQDIFINVVLHIDDKKRDILDVMPLVEDESVFEKDEDEVIDLGETFNLKLTVTEIAEQLNQTMSISRRTVFRKLKELYYEGYVHRTKVSGSWKYWEVKGYNVIEALNLEEIRDKIISIVDQRYIFYKNKPDAEMLPDFKK